MKTRNQKFASSRRAFTLIELLVVIAIIGVLAALIFPATRGINDKSKRSRALGELRLIESAINSYKAQMGHFPPDNPDNTTTWISPLYYELRGTTFNGSAYQLESGQGTMGTGAFPTFFGGTKIGGFVNSTKGGGEDAPVARNFLSGIKPIQYMLIQNGGVEGMVLGTALKGPVMLSDPTGQNFINPVRYRISGPDRQNPDGFDLWFDIAVSGGKTNRISNWRDGYELVQ
jgi:prepilin-type N-terminal cleavage/methylation domain-containing protein